MLAASCTEILLIQGITIGKRCSATSAEEFGLQRYGKAQTGWADRNTGKILQRLAAEPAFVGKNQVKKLRGNGFDAGEQCLWQAAIFKYDGASLETREDTPPLTEEYTISPKNVESSASKLHKNVSP